MKTITIRRSIAALFIIFNINSINCLASEKPWTLTEYVKASLANSPEIKSTQANLKISEAQREQVGTWDNPSLALEANNAMGLEDGKGGYDLSRAAISQSLGFSRQKKRINVATAELNAQKLEALYHQLQIENTAAKHFHDLQLAQEKYRLAEQRLKLADGLLIGDKKDQLVRYLQPAEKTRLRIAREQAEMEFDNARLTLESAQHQLAYMLTINSGDANSHRTIQAVPLDNLPQVPVDQQSETGLLQHPALQAQKQAIAAAEANIELAKAEKINPPELTLYQERDVLGGTRQNVTGIGIQFQIPVWNQGSAGINKAQAGLTKVQAEYDIRYRDAVIQLANERLRLSRFIKTASRFKQQLLEPSEQLLAINRKRFAAGDADVLTLVDAQNNYFAMQTQYLELLHDAWQADADYRLAAGQSLNAENLP